MPNVEKNSTTNYTETEDSLPYDINNVNIDEEIITHTKMEQSESVEQDVEIKTENDDDDNENSDSGAFEDVETKIEIVENEILHLLQSAQSLESVDLKIMKDGGTPSTQARNFVQVIDQGLTGTIVNRTSTNPINTTLMPNLKRKMKGSIQTDKEIVLSRNADESEGSINPEECICNRNNYIDMTRPQLCRACCKFLHTNIAITVRRQMHLDDGTKQDGNKLNEAGSSGGVKAGEVNATGCGGLAVNAEASAVACTRRRKIWITANVEKNSTTNYTETEDSLPYDINNVNIDEKIITHTKMEQSESVEQDVEIKTENDDDDNENSDSGAFEDVETKIEIVDNEILHLLQSAQSLESVDLKIMKDGGTPSTQARNFVQVIDQGLTGTIVNRTSTNPINTTLMPNLKRKIKGSIQEIVLSRNADESEGSINPEECICNRDNYIDMTRPQLCRACCKFLHTNIAVTVRRQMHLDDGTK